MASGMADYQGVVRPRYGAAYREDATVKVAANGETELLSVTGKGVIYGGCLYFGWTSTQKDSEPVLEVDGVVISQTNWYTLNFFNLVEESCSVFYLLLYDNVAFKYAAGIQGGITFEVGIKVRYAEANSTKPYVYARVIYALI